MKKNKLKLILGVCLSSMMLFSCGEPAENMNKTMADFIRKNVWIEEYDCDCYAKKVKEHFKTDEPI